MLFAAHGHGREAAAGAGAGAAAAAAAPSAPPPARGGVSRADGYVPMARGTLTAAPAASASSSAAAAAAAPLGGAATVSAHVSWADSQDSGGGAGYGLAGRAELPLPEPLAPEHAALARPLVQVFGEGLTLSLPLPLPLTLTLTLSLGLRRGPHAALPLASAQLAPGGARAAVRPAGLARPPRAAQRRAAGDIDHLSVG